MSRFQIVSAISAALMAAFIVAYLWFHVSPRRMDSLDVAFCLSLYAVAHTRGDSMIADSRTRENQGRQDVASLTCGALRAAYPDLFAQGQTTQ